MNIIILIFIIGCICCLSIISGISVYSFSVKTTVLTEVTDPNIIDPAPIPESTSDTTVDNNIQNEIKLDLPIDGEWTNWIKQGECDQTCGNGNIKYIRTCANPAPSNGGEPCEGVSEKVEPCNNGECPVIVDGKWSEWTDWSQCTVSCGGGTSQRSRTCKPAENGGIDCVGDSVETRDCNTQVCPKDGTWSDWSPWSQCSRPCGGGSQSRTRTCLYRAGTGSDCVGDNIEYQNCNTGKCSADGGWTEWTNWSKCNAKCGMSDIVSRTRTCTNPPPSNGGADCVGIASEIKLCQGPPCPIDGGWSTYFSAWILPPGGCGGNKIRTKLCNNPTPQYGGADCDRTLPGITEVEYVECIPVHPLTGIWKDSNPSSHDAVRSSKLATSGQPVIWKIYAESSEVVYFGAEIYYYDQTGTKIMITSLGIKDGIVTDDTTGMIFGTRYGDGEKYPYNAYFQGKWYYTLSKTADGTPMLKFIDKNGGEFNLTYVGPI